MIQVPMIMVLKEHVNNWFSDVRLTASLAQSEKLIKALYTGETSPDF